MCWYERALLTQFSFFAPLCAAARKKAEGQRRLAEEYKAKQETIREHMRSSENDDPELVKAIQRAEERMANALVEAERWERSALRAEEAAQSVRRASLQLSANGRRASNGEGAAISPPAASSSTTTVRPTPIRHSEQAPTPAVVVATASVEREDNEALGASASGEIAERRASLILEEPVSAEELAKEKKAVRVAAIEALRSGHTASGSARSSPQRRQGSVVIPPPAVRRPDGDPPQFQPRRSQSLYTQLDTDVPDHRTSSASAGPAVHDPYEI